MHHFDENFLRYWTHTIRLKERYNSILNTQPLKVTTVTQHEIFVIRCGGELSQLVRIAGAKATVVEI